MGELAMDEEVSLENNSNGPARKLWL